MIASTRHRARTPATRPVFEEMSPSDCHALLARNHVARLAFSFHDRVDIEPIHYVYDGEWLFGRTSPGSKLLTLAHNHWVALEIDETRDVFDWESVVLHGSFLTLDPEVPGVEAHAWSRGVELLRRVMPETLTAADPVAFRTVVFRVHVEAMTGRRATSADTSTGDRP